MNSTELTSPSKGLEPVSLASFTQRETISSTLELPGTLIPLEKEVLTWLRELPRLLAEGEQNRFALIKGEEVLSTWDTYRDALQYGYDKLGLEVPFLIQRLDPRDVEKLHHIGQAQESVSCPP